MQKFSIGTKVVNKTYGKGVVVHYNETALEIGLQPYTVKYEVKVHDTHDGYLKNNGYTYKSGTADCRFNYEHELTAYESIEEALK